MSKTSKICKHVSLIYKSNSELNFCKRCGAIGTKDDDSKLRFSIKPSAFNNELDTDPLEIFKIMKNLDKKQKNDSINHNYKERRPGMLKYLRKLISKNNLSDKSYHVATLYLDLIITKGNISESKYELIVIGCFLLSGIYFFKISQIF